MATAKKNTYVDMELEWLESKAAEIKAYVDAHPYDKVEDRLGWRELKGGGRMPVVIATIEQQHKALRDSMMDYAKITESVKRMREAEELKAKSTPRGDAALTPMEQGLIR